MCFGGDDPPQAPNNAPTFSTNEAKAGAAAAEIAKDPAVDDELAKQPPASQGQTVAKDTGADFSNLRM